MTTRTDSNIRTFAVDEGETLIKLGTRLKFKVTNGVIALATAAAADKCIGTAQSDWSSDIASANPAQGLRVLLNGQPQIFKAAAAGVTKGQELEAADGGLVVDQGAGTGLALSYIAFQSAAENERVNAYLLG